MIVYKVVYEYLDGVMASAMALPEGYETFYKINKASYAPRTPSGNLAPLMAFSTLEQADNFRKSIGTHLPYVLRCECEPVESEGPIKLSRFMSFENIDSLWASILEEEYMTNAPEGTVLCKWIIPLWTIPLEVIKEEDIA